MASTKTLIEEIRQLSARDRRVVIKQLQQLKTESSAVAGKLPTTRRRSKKRPYAALLELAGGAHSNEIDVSTDKYRHLAAAYADTHDAT